MTYVVEKQQENIVAYVKKNEICNIITPYRWNVFLSREF